MKFFIEESGREKPASERTIFADGTGAAFREGSDLELSHWIPNRTPAEFKADTSTEICLRFAETGRASDFDLVVNNHVDVDGVLSVFSLVDGGVAREHRETLVQAAAMGDFGGWGDERAQVLFQGLVLLMGELSSRKAGSQEVYERCIERASTLLLEGARAGDPILAGVESLRRAVERIESGEVARSLHHERFASYLVPERLAEEDLERCLRVPDFNEALSARSLVGPWARARLDAERVQLLSVGTREGWFHDLWYPGYMWADVVSAWRAPGIVRTGGFDQLLRHEPLLAARERLRASERASGSWEVADRIGAFAALEGRGFPVVLSFMRDKKPAPSSLGPEVVAPLLADAFLSEERVTMRARSA
ncbi:hypothetical protein HY251_21385 [bacterium]|nr:hypothetical protein [bacterium]